MTKPYKNTNIITILLENMKETLILMDRQLGYFEKALQVSGECAENPVEERIARAKITCTDTINNILAIPQAKSKLNNKSSKEAIQAGINLVDYNVPFSYASYYKNDNIKTLSMLIYFLNRLPAATEELKYILQRNREFHIINRQIQYLGINELFCEKTGKEIEEFYKVFLDSLKYFSADKLTWEKSSMIIEAKVEKLFADMETALERYSEYVGRQYNTYLGMKKDIEEIILQTGYSEQQRDKMYEEIELLARI